MSSSSRLLLGLLLVASAAGLSPITARPATPVVRHAPVVVLAKKGGKGGKGAAGGRGFAAAPAPVAAPSAPDAAGQPAPAAPAATREERVDKVLRDAGIAPTSAAAPGAAPPDLLTDPLARIPKQGQELLERFFGGGAILFGTVFLASGIAVSVEALCKVRLGHVRGHICEPPASAAVDTLANRLPTRPRHACTHASPRLASSLPQVLGTPLPAAVDSLLVDVVEPLLTPSILILFGEAVAERRLRDVDERDVGERRRREMSARDVAAMRPRGGREGNGASPPPRPARLPPLRLLDLARAAQAAAVLVRVGER